MNEFMTSETIPLLDHNPLLKVGFQDVVINENTSNNDLWQRVINEHYANKKKMKTENEKHMEHNHFY